MRWGWLYAALWLAGPLAAQEIPAPVLEAHADGDIRPLGVVIGPDRMSADGPVRWRDEVSAPGADYFRLLIRRGGDAPFPPGAELRISPAFDEVEPVALEDLDAAGIWTPVVYSSRAWLSLWSESPVGDAALIFDSIAVEADQIVQYSYYGTNDLKQINAVDVPDRYRLRAPAIAILHLIRGRDSTTCTGFLIAPDRLMTNEHCLNSDADCRSMYAVFGREIGPDKRMRLGPKRRCIGLEPAPVNYELDAAVAVLDAPLGADYPPVPLDSIVAPEGDLYIIQHPAGQPKQVSFIDCRAVASPIDGRAPGTDFTHTCDTAGGSSGAPVFDMQDRLVGLHHFGFEEDGQGIWTENRAVLGPHLAGWLTPAAPDAAPDPGGATAPPPDPPTSPGDPDATQDPAVGSISAQDAPSASPPEAPAPPENPAE